MIKYIIVSFLILTGCVSNSQDCNPDLAKCNLIWDEIHSNQNQFSNMICDYFYYEQSREKFTKKDFINFLTSNEYKQDTLVSLLNQINFKLISDEDFILCYTNISMLDCVENFSTCPDSILNNEIILFREPIINCRKKYRNNQIEVFPFAEGKHKHDEYIQNLKFNVLKLKYIDELFDAEKLFYPSEIKNNERIRKTVFSVSKVDENRWKNHIVESSHIDKESIQTGEQILLSYLNNDDEVKSSSIDSMIIVLRYFESDQGNSDD